MSLFLINYFELIYKKQEPNIRLSNIVKCFWMIDSNDDELIKKEKIIPDGYPEMIFHYQQPYRTNINGHWFEQGIDLIAGQIKNYFYLENIGKIGMFAIKFQPWALKMIFNIDMYKITDDVIDIPEDIQNKII